jgi:carbamoyltransferase
VPGIFRECGFRGHFHFIGHHLCHAASSFYMTPLATAAVMVIDGIGEHESTTIYRGSSAGLELMWQQSYPHSLGFLWEKLAMHLGFSEYDAAKIMALAAYGDPTRYRAALAEIVTVTPEIAVDDQIVRFRSRDHSAIEAALGIPKRRSPIHELEPEDQPYADLAASLQEVTETAMLALAARARDIDSALCLSGGVALNCVGIGRILESNLFDAIYVPPASHDAGTAIGAALYLRHVVFGSTDRPVQLSPYLGPSFTAGEIDETLFDNAVAFEREDGDVEERIATLIASGYTVAWCHGRMEFGPRALGHRSVLADPRTLESVRKLTSIKHRASFDPFAPAVLQEELANWFDVPSTENVSAHYMVSSYRAHDNKRARIPAVVHVDGTSRVQSVSRIYAPRLHRMIRAFWRLTGVPIVLNTSFNDREPIVGSPTDALATAIRAGVDYLVMEDRIVNLREQAIDINVPDLTLEAYFEKLR